LRGEVVVVGRAFVFPMDHLLGWRIVVDNVLKGVVGDSLTMHFLLVNVCGR